MHVHVGILKGLLTFLDVIIFGFFWRLISMSNADTSVGQAMAFIY